MMVEGSSTTVSIVVSKTIDVGSIPASPASAHDEKKLFEDLVRYLGCFLCWVDGFELSLPWYDFSQDTLMLGDWSECGLCADLLAQGLFIANCLAFYVTCRLVNRY